MKTRAAGARARLPVSGAPDARRQLPLLSELLRLRARGARAARRAARDAGSPCGASCRCQPFIRAVTTRFPIHRTLNPASPRASRIRFTARLTVDQEHGYATPDPVADLLLFGADAVAGVGARAQPAGRAGGRRPRRPAAEPPVQHSRRRTARRQPRRRQRCRAPRRRPRHPPRGQTVEVRTDLYVADIDTIGGTITRVALDKHRDAQDPTKPYLALQRNADRTFIAQAGLIGDGLPNHRTPYEVLPGPRDARAGRRRVATEAASDRRQRRQGRPDADVPSRQLRDRRRVRRHQRRRGADQARGVFPADARHEARRACKARWRRRRSSGRSSTTSRTSSRRSTSARSTRKPPTRRASPRTRTQRDNGWIGMIEHYFVAAWLPPDDAEAAAPVLHDEARQRPVHGRACRYAEATIAPGGNRRDPRAPLRRPAGPGRARQARAGPRSRRRLRHLHDHRGAAVLAAEVAARPRSATGAGRSS